jgi:conjugal transfer mating pair stabilization protein TraG
VEIGHAVAGDPALMERMYDRLDRLGLTGDHQRLAGSWSYAQVFADREQARAAAGMALLLGYGEGERQLTPDEQQAAREAGLRDSRRRLRAPRAGHRARGKHGRPEEAHPAPGGARARGGRGGLSDPRTATEGLPGEIAAHRGLTAERYDPTAVDRVP